MLENPPASAGEAREVDLIHGSGRSPGVGNGNLLQYFSRRNSRRRLVVGATCRKTLISWSALDKNLKAGYLFEGK